VATIIDPTDDLRYEVVQIKNYDLVLAQTLQLSTTSQALALVEDASLHKVF